MSPRLDILFPSPTPTPPGILIVDLTAGQYLNWANGTPAWVQLPAAGASGIAPATLLAALVPLKPGYPAPGFASASLAPAVAALLTPGNSAWGFSFDSASGDPLGGMVDLSGSAHQLTVNGTAHVRL